jgi:PadR family transcriptional regulator, regulatory protein PadR
VALAFPEGVDLGGPCGRASAAKLAARRRPWCGEQRSSLVPQVLGAAQPGGGEADVDTVDVRMSRKISVMACLAEQVIEAHRRWEQLGKGGIAKTIQEIPRSPAASDLFGDATRRRSHEPILVCSEPRTTSLTVDALTSPNLIPRLLGMGSGDVAGGQLELLLLATVAGLGSGHGYAIIAGLRDRSRGTFDLPEGSVYPALQRLERQDLLTSGWDDGTTRPRRVYRLTDAGHRALAERRQRWRTVATSVNRVLRWVS